MTTFLIIVGAIALLVVVARLKRDADERKHPKLKAKRLRREKLELEQRRITEAWQRGELNARDAAIRLAEINSELHGTIVVNLGERAK